MKATHLSTANGSKGEFTSADAIYLRRATCFCTLRPNTKNRYDRGPLSASRLISLRLRFGRKATDGEEAVCSTANFLCTSTRRTIDFSKSTRWTEHVGFPELLADYPSRGIDQSEHGQISLSVGLQGPHTKTAKDRMIDFSDTRDRSKTLLPTKPCYLVRDD